MKHLAIIADGNRRWAKKNNLPIELGYSQGLVTIENTCDWAIKQKLEHLTFYCFSTENWGRAPEEVSMLFKLAEDYFTNQLPWYIKRGIRVLFIGRRDRFKSQMISMIENTEYNTRDCNKLTLHICIDYGGRDEIVRAIDAGAKTEEEISAFLASSAPYPDAILRTGGQKRLSNFMLWQAAYSELIFRDELFPELYSNILDEVLCEYKNRQRSFGK